MNIAQKIALKAYNYFTPNQTAQFNKAGYLKGYGVDSINWNNQNYLKDYLEVPEVSAVVGILVRAFANGRLRTISKSNGKDVVTTDAITKIIANPNWMQSQAEFVMQTKLFREIFGNEYIYLLTPVGLPNSIKAMTSLPPQIVSVENNNTSDTPYFKSTEKPKDTRYYYEWNGVKQEIDYLNNLIHINSNAANITPSNYIVGESSLASLQPAIQNIRSAYEARNVIITNRGALGILSNDSKDAVGSTKAMDPKAQKDLQDDFAKYGMSKSQWQVIITNMSLKWQQMSIDVAGLKLFEECEADTQRICDKYGVPYELLGASKGTTFANKNEANKLLYQNTIIPQAIEWVGALNDRFDTKNKSYEIAMTYDHLPVMQENLKERGASLTLTTNAMSKALADGAITIQQYQNELKKYGI